MYKPSLSWLCEWTAGHVIQIGTREERAARCYGKVFPGDIYIVAFRMVSIYILASAAFIIYSLVTSRRRILN